MHESDLTSSFLSLLELLKAPLQENALHVRYGVLCDPLLGDGQVKALAPDFEVLLQTEQLSDLLEGPCFR